RRPRRLLAVAAAIAVLGASAAVGSVDAQAVAAEVGAAVVDIETVVPTLGQSGEAAGTGMVLTPAGLVLTNNHVVQGSTGIRVTIPSSGKTYAASVVGVDPADDVALIQIDGVSDLHTLTLADSSTLI